MLRVAIVEQESVAKDVVFELEKIFHDYVWTFQYFTSMVELAKTDHHSPFDMFVFHEKFHTDRIYDSLIKGRKRFVIYTMEKCVPLGNDSPFCRMLSMDRHHIKEEIQRIKENIITWIKEQEEYLFSYNGVKLALKIHEIHYIEKQNKNLIFHTDKGQLYERGSMSEAKKRFEPLGFLHIHSSYLVNFSDIIQVEGDMMILQDHTELPIARSKKQDVRTYFQKFIS